MKVGDLVKVTIESGYEDIGLIMKVDDTFNDVVVYEVRCQKSKTECIATEDMLELISKSQFLFT